MTTPKDAMNQQELYLTGLADPAAPAAARRGRGQPTRDPVCGDPGRGGEVVNAVTPGPAVDLIEHAARIIIASRKQPYTAPAHWAGALWEAGMLVAPGSALQVAAPAGDGGLREALERLRDQLLALPDVTGEELSEDLQEIAEDLTSLLAAHPAAPAVPQPAANRERMIEVLGGSELAAATVDHLLESGVIRDAAVPPPVDRLAIERVLRKRMQNSNFTAIKHEPVRTQYIDSWVEVFADAVLAVLAGEQEQSRG